MGWLDRAICRMRGHAFAVFADGFKRRCARCSREEWVMTRPYPRIGEAKSYWHHMDWEQLDRRRPLNPTERR